eukprot:7915443-Karenia_brevis.AAC.1
MDAANSLLVAKAESTNVACKNGGNTAAKARANNFDNASAPPFKSREHLTHASSFFAECRYLVPPMLSMPIYRFHVKLQRSKFCTRCSALRRMAAVPCDLITCEN